MNGFHWLGNGACFSIGKSKVYERRAVHSRINYNISDTTDSYPLESRTSADEPATASFSYTLRSRLRSGRRRGRILIPRGTTCRVSIPGAESGGTAGEYTLVDRGVWCAIKSARHKESFVQACIHRLRASSWDSLVLGNSRY